MDNAVIEYTDEFLDIVRIPNYIIKGFYYRFRTTDGNMTENYLGNCLIYKDFIDFSFQISEKLLDNRLTYLDIFYIDLMNDIVNNYKSTEFYRTDNIKKVCTIDCFQGGSTFIFNSEGGKDVVRLRVCQYLRNKGIQCDKIYCDIKNDSEDYVKHIDGPLVDRDLYRRATNDMMVDRQSGLDELKESLITKTTNPKSFVMNKSGLIDI